MCLDYRHMQSEVGDPGRISLNLSLKQLRQASFILRCRSVFRRHGVSPTSFELEITETTLMADAKRTVRLLDELYAMGLHLSIDDFGTGYSSLSALQQFPIGTLKIDQSFVRDVSDDAGDATIVRTIIDMGRSLGMDVVAEGIESQRHLEFLRRHNCHFGQGKLFGEPCTSEELQALLARQASGTPPFAHLLGRRSSTPSAAVRRNGTPAPPGAKAASDAFEAARCLRPHRLPAEPVFIDAPRSRPAGCRRAPQAWGRIVLARLLVLWGGTGIWQTHKPLPPGTHVEGRVACLTRRPTFRSSPTSPPPMPTAAR